MGFCWVTARLDDSAVPLLEILTKVAFLQSGPSPCRLSTDRHTTRPGLNKSRPLKWINAVILGTVKAVFPTLYHVFRQSPVTGSTGRVMGVLEIQSLCA